jgi:hypothetical protein
VLVAKSLGQGIARVAADPSGADDAPSASISGASAPTTVTLAVAADDERHYDGVVARAVLLCRRCDSEPMVPLAGLALRS